MCSSLLYEPTERERGFLVSVCVQIFNKKTFVNIESTTTTTTRTLGLYFK